MTAQQRWQEAAQAASLLGRALEARTSTATTDLVRSAGDHLDAAGLVGMAYEAWEIAGDWQGTDDDIRPLLEEAQAACSRLETEYLGRVA